MADSTGAPVTGATPPSGPAPFQPVIPTSLDEARALARERFKTRLQAGEKIGECAVRRATDTFRPSDDHAYCKSY